MTDFTGFGLAEAISSTLTEGGYDSPTPIQEQAIPLILEGHDLLGIAQTGTGKTLAFTAPILDRLARDMGRAAPKTMRALILAPTRELASQIAKSVSTYGRKVRPSVATIFGGVKIQKQIRQMSAGMDVVVATPGRLLDLIDQGAVTLDGVEMLVLDEADQMLDLGFIHSLKRIVRLLPKERQTLFFSATMPKSIKQLADTYLRDPVQVSVTPESTTAERVEQQGYYASKTVKPQLLAHVLKQDEVKSALVFTRTKHGADRVVKQLARHDIEAVAIHGNKSQNQRERALGAFRSGKVWVLVATDIAARGIDISGLTHVINFELPNVPEQYVHRIGRTGRAGAEGKAISFIADDERGFLKDIQRVTKSKLWMLALPGDLPQPSAEKTPTEARLQREEEAQSEARNARTSRNRKPADRKGADRKPRGARPAQRAEDAPAAEGRRFEERSERPARQDDRRRPYKARSNDDARGDTRSDHRGDKRNDTRGDKRNFSRDEARGETRRDTRGEGRSDNRRKPNPDRRPDDRNGQRPKRAQDQRPKRAEGSRPEGRDSRPSNKSDAARPARAEGKRPPRKDGRRPEGKPGKPAQRRNGPPRKNGTQGRAAR
ncbi:DEAD/DEAH box helicase [Parvularcula marina]|uniref:DEAD/DEAH box helicase n=1 Tax=Parvularcula marina TaxID=2292771 RepID=UPI00351248A3